MHCFEVSDPLTYNNREPGPEVVHRWHPAGHRWWVFQSANDAWSRIPLSDDWGYGSGTGTWDKCVTFLYPDPVACPTFENEVDWPRLSHQKFDLGQCMWGYDFHHRYYGLGELKAGDERVYKTVFTAMPRAEADRRFAESTLFESFQKRAKTAYVPFDPTGTTFEKTTTLADPSTTMCWMGGVRDDTVGHGDTYSLRIDGPGKARVFLYQYMIEQYAPAWRISGWVKTRDVADKGVALRVKYSYGKQLVAEGLRGGELFALCDGGTHDWTPFTVITTVPRVQDATDLLFEVDGAGQVWLDDIAMSALTDDDWAQTSATPK